MAVDEGDSGELRIVLVAAADAATRTAVSLTLGGESYEVVQAVDAQEALLGVAKHRPALLIIDQELPGASGFMIAKSIKAQPETGDAKVVVMYEKGAAFDEAAGRSLGVDEFLAKPFTSLGLLKKVNAVLA